MKKRDEKQSIWMGKSCENGGEALSGLVIVQKLVERRRETIRQALLCGTTTISVVIISTNQL
jgi:hypothetical protein